MDAARLLAVVLALCAGPQPTFSLHRRGEPPDSRTVEMHMPAYQPTENDAYVCAGLSVAELTGTEDTVWVTQFRVLSDADTAHHMLLFQCESLTPEQERVGKWECGHHGVCRGSQVMYAWAKNAPATKLPDDVGFKIGGDTGHTHLVLQIHYAHPLPKPDTSGVELTLSSQSQRYQAGIYLLVDGRVIIPPNTPVTHADVNCAFDGEVPIHAFAARVHAHSLGKVITGYRFNLKNSTLAEMARGNPQWPQAFYPMKRIIDVYPGDYLHARCTFDSTGRNRTTRIGATSADEMCNLYVMYYTDAAHGRSSFVCGGENIPALTAALPEDSDTPLPPNPLLEEHAKHVHKEDMKQALSYNPVDAPPPPREPAPAIESNLVGTVMNPDDFEGQRSGKAMGGVSFVPNWGGSAHTFGQVVAVSSDSAGHVVLFHRASRTWDGGSFDASSNRLRDTSQPIPENTIIYMKNDTGEIVLQMGARFFHMPHGLTVDHEDNVWCTDVGMHQVFKFGARGGDGKPLLTLGTLFEPGNDDDHFCKPTAVAVMRDGSFFVADGYCNTRILKFGPSGGRPIKRVGRASSTFAIFGSLLGRAPALDEFNIPHSLALVEQRNLVCAADRENGRVVCFRASDLGQTDVQVTWQRSRIFAVAYSPVGGGSLYAVSGPNFYGNKIQGYIVNMDTKTVTSTFSPSGNGFSNPHDVSVSRDGQAVYVVELAPRKVWKFVSNEAHNPTRKNLASAAGDQGGAASAPEDPTVEFVKSAGGPASADSDSSALSGHAKLVVMALFGVPVLLFAIVMVVVRLRKRSQRRRFMLHNINQGYGHQKSLGSFLSGKEREGFEPLNTEDLDEESDSDVEEFIAKIKSRT